MTLIDSKRALRAAMRAKRESLGDVARPYGIAFGKVGDGAGNPQDSGPGPAGQAESLERGLEQFFSSRVECRVAPQALA